MTDTTEKPLAGLIALVTGATRGIGRASAIGLAEAGAHVIAVGRTQGALVELDDEIKARTGESATLAPMDLAELDGVDTLAGVIAQRWGRLDILVHAAAQLGDMTPVSYLDPKVWDKVLLLNMSAPFRLIRALEPLFRASKAGMDALVATWTDELENTPIRPVLLSPGPMRTRMRAQAFPGEDPMTLPDPSEIAPLVVELARPDLSPAAYVEFKAWKAART